MEQWDVIFTSLLLKTLDSVLLCNPIPLPQAPFPPTSHPCRSTQLHTVLLPDLTPFIPMPHILRKLSLLMGYLVVMTLLSCFNFPHVTEDHLKTHIGVETHVPLFDHLFGKACLNMQGPPVQSSMRRVPFVGNNGALASFFLPMSLSSFMGSICQNI